jgi:hypothetical protein
LGADDANIVVAMDPQFQELAATITRDVTEAVTERVTATVTERVTASVTTAVTERVTESVTTAVTASVTEAVTATVNRHVSEVVAAAEARLSEQARISLEAVREQATLAAEGYAGTLDSINRHLDRIEQRMDSTFALHGAAVKNHNDRLTALEHDRT